MNMGNGYGETNGAKSADSGWVTVRDASEGAFTLQMPAGWKNEAHMTRPYEQIRSVVNSQSPDGQAFVFLGDPNLPTFTEPSFYHNMGLPAMDTNPLLRAHPYVPAQPFFADYVQQRFGNAPGFRILGVQPNPELERLIHEKAQRWGMQFGATTITVHFEYQENGTPIRGLVYGATVNTGSVWVADVSGVLTTGNPAQYEPILRHMVASYTTDPRWQQQQNAQHQQKMAQIQANHQSWMATSQAMHQSRMDAIRHAGQVNTQMFQERQAQSDAIHASFMNSLHQTPSYAEPSAPAMQDDFSHQRFVNYIRDEETVVDSAGQQYQVDTGGDRYFINRNDNTYIRTDSTVERSDLHRYGVNPDDYEEGQIRR
ncbi:MAG: hypothetical protein OHK0029_10650 [Armatimonadaceae bacterium]